MKRLALVLVLVAIRVGSAAAAQDAERITVPLTDSSRPATLEIDLWAGVINVVAVDAGTITIDAKTIASAAAPGGPVSGRSTVRRFGTGARRDATGLTRLPQPAPLDVEEANNVVRLRGPSKERIDLDIHVPVRTNLRLTKSAPGRPNSPGAVTVRGVDGDLEIRTKAGTITLTDVSGSVVAHSTNGSVIATLGRVAADRPMAFTSYGGSVDVTLPGSVKANVILQSGRGDVFTNFDVQTRNDVPGGAPPAGGSFRRSGRQPIRGTMNGGGPDIELRTYAGSVYLRRGPIVRTTR